MEHWLGNWGQQDAEPNLAKGVLLCKAQHARIRVGIRGQHMRRCWLPVIPPFCLPRGIWSSQARDQIQDAIATYTAAAAVLDP